jgi:hypothetical protein
LDNLDNLRVELKYQIQQLELQSKKDDSRTAQTKKNDDDDINENDIRQYMMATYQAMQQYLEIVPPTDLQRAKEIMNTTTRDIGTVFGNTIPIGVLGFH